MASPTRSGEPLTDRELAAWRGMLRTHSDVVARLDAELERDHGLPLSSYEVLISLADAPDGRLRMGELAERTPAQSQRPDPPGGPARARREWSRASAARTTPAGYFAVITAGGRRKLRDARPAHLAGVREHFLERLTSRDLDALAAAWEKVASA